MASSISEDTTCPLCLDTMTEATILCPSGVTYCYHCLSQALEYAPKTDPTHRTEYDEVMMVPNYALRQIIEKLGISPAATIEDSTVVTARIVSASAPPHPPHPPSNQNVCKFGKKCRRFGCYFLHPEGQSQLLTIAG